MNTRQALMLGVCEEPADDLRRMIFADFCEENGEEDLARFIRLSLKLQDDWLKMDVECLSLLKKKKRNLSNRQIWASPLSRLYTQQWEPRDSWFWRGFVNTASSSYTRWMEHGEQVVKELPIEKLEIHGKMAFPLDPEEADDVALDPSLHDSDYQVYGWEIGEDARDHRQIPASIVSCMPDIIQPRTRVINGKIRTFVVWPLRGLAEDALEIACLRFARSKAGFPDLVVSTSS